MIFVVILTWQIHLLVKFIIFRLINLDISPSEFQMDYGTDDIQLLSDHSLDTSLNDKGHDKLSRSQFIDEQHRDPEISCLFGKAVSKNEVSQAMGFYFTKNGILMR